MSTYKVAVIIADSYGEPFESIKAEIQPSLWKFENQPDIFYMKGDMPTALQRHLNQITDSKRYSKAWPIQHLFDRIQLGLKSRKKVQVKQFGVDLHLDIPEGLRYLGLKLINTYEYLYEQNYDVVYRTTLSSLVNNRNFLLQVSRIDLDSPYYGGTLINFGHHPFVSGANLMMNRKTIEILLNAKNRWNHGLLDDASIGRLLEGKVRISEISTLNLSTLDDVERLTSAEIDKTTHFRCVSSNLVRNDIEIMRELKKRLT